jgi:nucleoside 2-deoxyribosyltransferase
MSSAGNYQGQFNPIQRANLAGWIRNKIDPPTLTSELFDPLKSLPTPTVHEKAQILFTYFCKKYPIAGQQISELDIIMNGVGSSEEKRENIFMACAPIEGICSLTGREELKYVISNYLVEEEHFIKLQDGQYFITPKGWHHFEEHPLSISDIAFVAMSFKDELDPLFNNVIKPAIKKAGWNAFRIKEERHNNYITNEIISGIRRSKFMIADFTDNCEGAYYEAGYAKGLGIPVIHMVNDEYLTGKNQAKKLHFDTLQMYHLPWKTGNETKDVENLFHQIIVTVGNGPIK